MKTLSYRAASEFLEFLEAWDIQATDMFSRRDLARAEKYREIVKVDKGDCIDTDDVSDRIDSSLSGMSCPCSSFKTCRSIDGLQYCLSYLLLDRIEDTLDSPCIPESLPKPPPSQCNELSDQARKDIEEAISDTIGRVDTFLKSAGSEKSEGADKESALAERATCAESDLVTNKSPAVLTDEWRATHVLLAIRQRLQFCEGLYQSYLTEVTGSEENPTLFFLRQKFNDHPATWFLRSIDPQCLPLGISTDSDLHSHLVEALLACCEILAQKEIHQNTDETQEQQDKDCRDGLTNMHRRHLDPTLLVFATDPDSVVQELMEVHEKSNDDDKEKIPVVVKGVVDTLVKFPRSGEVAVKEMVSRLTKVLRDGNITKRMRILQWEILLRDLYEETLERKFVYKVGTTEQKMHSDGALLSSGSPEFLLGLSDCALITTETAEACEKGEKALKAILQYAKHFKDWREHHQKQAQKNFQWLLQRVQDLNPKAFDDLIHTFGRIRTRKHLPLHPLESTIVLEDGEMTFFSILWLFRYQHASHGDFGHDHRFVHSMTPTGRNDDHGRGFAFPPSAPILSKERLEKLINEDKEKHTEWWAITGSDGSLGLIDQLRFLYQLGLGMLVPNAHQTMDDVAKWEVIPTQRASSFVQWLRKTSLLVRQQYSTQVHKHEVLSEILTKSTCEATTEELRKIIQPLQDWLFDESLSEDERHSRWEKTIAPLIPMLPIKEYDYDDQEQRWIVVLISFFLSSVPGSLFSEWLKAEAYRGKGLSLATALQWSMPSSPWWLLLTTPEARSNENGDSSGFHLFDFVTPSEGGAPRHRDRLVDRLCRSPYFPLEFLYRVYQPYPIQLLIMPHGFTPAPEFLEDKSIEEIPSSLAFTTIAGWLPPMSWHQQIPSPQPYDSHRLQVHSPITMNTLSPYWEYGLGLSIPLAITMIHNKTLKVGEQEGVRKAVTTYSHEIRNSCDFLFNKCFSRLKDRFHLCHSEPGAADQDNNTGVILKLEPTLEPLSSTLLEWYVCPLPDIFDAARSQALISTSAANENRTLLGSFYSVGGNLRDVILERLWPHACGMAVARILNERDPMTATDIIAITNDWHEGLDMHIKRLDLECPIDVSWSPFEDRQRHDVRDQLQSRFIRAFIASCSNAIQHSPEDTAIQVKIIPKDGGYSILFQVINERLLCDLVDRKPGGTELVLRVCLEDFGKDCIQTLHFCPSDIDGNPLKDAKYWVSSFIAPIFQGDRGNNDNYWVQL